MRKLIIGLMAATAFGFVNIADGLAISNQQNGDAPAPREKPKVQQKAADPCSQAAKACWDRCAGDWHGVAPRDRHQCPWLLLRSDAGWIDVGRAVFAGGAWSGVDL